LKNQSDIQKIILPFLFDSEF